MKHFPQIAGPLRPGSKHAVFERMVGKTIDRVVAGDCSPGKGCHNREVLIIHFTDGTALAIDVASNAGNFESRGLDPTEFSTDFMPSWA